MCIYIYIYVICVDVYVCMYVYVYIYIYIYMYDTYMYKHICVSLHDLSVCRGTGGEREEHAGALEELWKHLSLK